MDPAELFQLGFLVGDMLAHLGIVFHDLHFLGLGALVLGGRVEVAGSGRGFKLDFFACAFFPDALRSVCRCQKDSPRLRKSARTASMPFLSMVRRPALETRRRTQRFSVSTQIRRYCRFGRKRRLV